MQIFCKKIAYSFGLDLIIEFECIPGPDYDNHSGSDDYIGKNDSLFIGYFKQILSLLGNRKQFHEKNYVKSIHYNYWWKIQFHGIFFESICSIVQILNILQFHINKNCSIPFTEILDSVET